MEFWFCKISSHWSLLIDKFFYLWNLIFFLITLFQALFHLYFTSFTWFQTSQANPPAHSVVMTPVKRHLKYHSCLGFILPKRSRKIGGVVCKINLMGQQPLTYTRNVYYAPSLVHWFALVLTFCRLNLTVDRPLWVGVYTTVQLSLYLHFIKTYTYPVCTVLSLKTVRHLKSNTSSTRYAYYVPVPIMKTKIIYEYTG